MTDQTTPDPATGTEAGTGERPAAPGSALERIRARRAKAKAALHLDLKVPRYDPPIVVRYKPIDQQVLDRANKLAAESKDPDRLVIANAVALAHACLGVYDVKDGKVVSLDPGAEPPRFDERLAEILELPAGAQAADVVRGLYFTDGDVIAAADRLSAWSAQAQVHVDEETSGN